MNRMELLEDKNTPPPKKKWSAWLGLAAAILYALSPIDFLPDVIPGIGWIDDVALILIAILNLAEVKVDESNPLLMNIARTFKWILIALLVLIVLVALLLGSSIFHLFN